MIKKFKFTFVLLILNALAFLILFIISNKKYKATINIETLASNIALVNDDIDTIKISGSLIDNTIILKKEINNWLLEKPLKWPANNFNVYQIIHQLSLLRETSKFTYSELLESNQNLEDFGLNNPKIKFEISKENQELEIILGSTTALGGKIYLYLPQTQIIYIVESSIYDSNFVDINNIKQKQVMNIPIYEIDAMSYQVRTTDLVNKNQLSVLIEKNKSDDKWYFNSPLKTQADSSQVLKTIKDISTAEVEKFLPLESLDSEMLGFKNPYMKISLEGNKRRSTLILGNSLLDENNKKAYYAKLEDNDTIFTLKSDLFDRFIEADKALRERNFIALKENPTTIDIAAKDAQVKLQKLENGIWQVVPLDSEKSYKPFKADQDIINLLIENFSNISALDYFSDNPTKENLSELGFDSPQKNIELYNKENLLFSLSVVEHPSDDSLLLAYLKNGTTIYSIDKNSFFQNFKIKPLHFKDRIIEKLPLSAEIISIKIAHTKKLKETNVFSYYAEDKSTFIPLDLINALKEISVENYIDGTFSEKIKDADDSISWNYKLDFEIVLPGDITDKIETRTYFLGKRASGSLQLGGTPNQNLIFELSQDMINALYPYISNFEASPESKNLPIETPESIKAINP